MRIICLTDYEHQLIMDAVADRTSLAGGKKKARDYDSLFKSLITSEICDINIDETNTAMTSIWVGLCESCANEVTEPYEAVADVFHKIRQVKFRENIQAGHKVLGRDHKRKLILEETK